MLFSQFCLLYCYSICSSSFVWRVLAALVWCCQVPRTCSAWACWFFGVQLSLKRRILTVRFVQCSSSFVILPVYFMEYVTTICTWKVTILHLVAFLRPQKFSWMQLVISGSYEYGKLTVLFSEFVTKYFGRVSLVLKTGFMCLESRILNKHIYLPVFCCFSSRDCLLGRRPLSLFSHELSHILGCINWVVERINVLAIWSAKGQFWLVNGWQLYIQNRASTVRVAWIAPTATAKMAELIRSNKIEGTTFLHDAIIARPSPPNRALSLACLVAWTGIAWRYLCAYRDNCRFCHRKGFSFS